MRLLLTGVISVLATMSGCAHDAYQPAQNGPGEEQTRALADCRAKGAGMAGPGLIGALTYSQFMDDCMRAKGFVPKV